MAEIIGGAIVIGVGFIFIYAGAQWVITAFRGKCIYCGSKDFVPDDGLYFYCNGCRRKF